MIYEFSLFGFQIFQFSKLPLEAVLGEEEYISNTGGDFELADVPYGFAFHGEDEEDDE